MRKLAPWLLSLALATPAAAEEPIFTAARAGDLATVKQLVESGVEVDSTTAYGASPLTYACDKGQLEVVRYLVEQGADINRQDTFYNAQPIIWATMNGHTDVITFLIEQGAEGAQGALMMAIQGGRTEVAEKIVGTGKLDQETLDGALAVATQQNLEGLISTLQKAGAKPPEPTGYTAPAELLAAYAGRYEGENFAMTLELDEHQQLKASVGPQTMTLEAIDETHFRLREMPIAKLEMIRGEDGRATQIKLTNSGNEFVLNRAEDPADEDTAKSAEESSEDTPSDDTAGQG